MSYRLLSILLAGLLSLSASCTRGEPTPKTLQYIANWEELAPSRIVEVLDAYTSGRRSLDGDHVNLFRLRLEPKASQLKHALTREQLREPLILKALETAGGSRRVEATWFPDAAALQSERFQISLPELTAYHGRVEAVKLTALDTESGVLYHADVAW